ncbi:TPA_asm: hypothetical protein [Monosiga MELD virus 1]|nr:TPA_asm: hypothetical protein [Monosiga MELD virus 1]
MGRLDPAHAAAVFIHSHREHHGERQEGGELMTVHMRGAGFLSGLKKVGKMAKTVSRTVRQGESVYKDLKRAHDDVKSAHDKISELYG